MCIKMSVRVHILCERNVSEEKKEKIKFSLFVEYKMMFAYVCIVECMHIYRLFTTCMNCG